MQRQSLYSFLILLTLSAGCTSAVTPIAQARADATMLVQNAQATRSQLTAKLSTMPAADPARSNIQSELEKLDQLIASTEASLPRLDAAARSTTQPAIDPTIAQAAAAIPYGSLAVAVVGLIFGIVKHIQNNDLVDKQQDAEKAFEQIVGALDSALPAPTPDQQARVNAVLDTDVKAKVAAVRTV